MLEIVTNVTCDTPFSGRNPPEVRRFGTKFPAVGDLQKDRQRQLPEEDPTSRLLCMTQYHK